MENMGGEEEEGDLEPATHQVSKPGPYRLSEWAQNYIHEIYI